MSAGTAGKHRPPAPVKVKTPNPARRHLAGWSFLLALACGLAAEGGYGAATGHVAIAGLAVCAAVLAVVGALLIRVNWRLLEQVQATWALIDVAAGQSLAREQEDQR